MHTKNQLYILIFSEKIKKIEKKGLIFELKIFYEVLLIFDEILTKLSVPKMN